MPQYWFYGCLKYYRTIAGLKIIIENNRFQELIQLNRRAVLSSAVLAVIAICYLSLKLYETHHLLFNKISLKLISDSTCISIFIFQLIELFLFLDLFYFIIKQDK